MNAIFRFNKIFPNVGYDIVLQFSVRTKFKGRCADQLSALNVVSPIWITMLCALLFVLKFFLLLLQFQSFFPFIFEDVKAKSNLSVISCQTYMWIRL